MPREIISSVHTDDFRIEVGWEKGRFAQIAVTTDQKLKVADLKNVGSSGIGLRATLDVDTITQLQKVLARAKKQLQMEPDPLNE